MFLTTKKYNEILGKINLIENKLNTHSDHLQIITKENAPQLSEDEKRKVAYALNLCTVSVSQIIDYNDIYILEQEYDAILNNLNLQTFIKDEALLNVLKQILDTITFFKIQEGDKKFIEKEYQHKMKNAIWSAVPNLSIIFAGGNPITMAVTAAAQIGIGYMNYRRNKSQYALEKEKQEWELQRSAIEQFNGLRRELFETAWRLSDAYDFDDKYRITEKQISRYNKILLDPDPLRRYEKLDVISDTFMAFPPFWYYKANAAKDIYRSDEYKNTEIGLSFKDKALEAYREYDKIYVKFMREDVIAASCALEHISLLDPNKKNENDEIEKLLLRAIELAGENFDVLQMSVLIYVSINKIKEAKSTLQKLINEDYNIGLNGLLLSRIYCKYDKNRVDYDILEKRIGSENIMPWLENDIDSENEYIASRKDVVIWRFKEYLKSLTNKINYSLLKSIDLICDSLYGSILEYRDWPEKIIWFKNASIVENIVVALNQYFIELGKIDIFDLINYNENWNDFLIKQALIIQEKIKEYYREINETKQFVNNKNVHTVNKGHIENMFMVQKIDTIVGKLSIELFVNYIRNEILKIIKNNFSVKTAESSEIIIGSIDTWYNKNKINIPSKKNIENLKSNETNLNNDFFSIENILKDNIN